MKIQSLFVGVLLIACVLLADGAFAGKGKKVVKGQSVFTPSKLTTAATKSKIPLPPKVIDPQQKTKTEDLIKKNSPNWNTSGDQQAALGKLLGDQPLTGDDRQQLNDLLFNAQAAGLTKEDEEALSYLLLDEAARNNDGSAVNAPSEDRTGPWFLRVYNKTGERLKVWVQVLPDKEDKKENQKKEPPKKADTLQYDLAAGKAYDLQYQGKRVQASAIKVWAISPSRSWAHHRDEALYLTTPANNSKTYTLTFSDKEP